MVRLQPPAVSETFLAKLQRWRSSSPTDEGKGAISIGHLGNRKRPFDTELWIEGIQASFGTGSIRLIVEVEELAIFCERLETMRKSTWYQH